MLKPRAPHPDPKKKGAFVEYDQEKIDKLMAHFPELLPCGCEYEV